MPWSPPRGLLHLLRGDLRAVCRRWLAEHRAESRRAAWMRRPDPSFIGSLLPGLRMRFYRDDELAWLIHDQHFEWREREFLGRFLRPGDVFVDAGASIGLYTLLAAQRVGPAGRVLSFEPCARTFERLAENVALNEFSHVACVGAALSDREGCAVLTAFGGGQDARNSLAAPPPGEACTREPVSVTTVDGYLRSCGLAGNRIAMMKIDVEGFEARVLRGARDTLRGPNGPVLQIEFADEMARAAGSSCAELHATLAELGYSTFTFDPLTGVHPQTPRAGYPYVNLFAARRIEDITTRLGA